MTVPTEKLLPLVERFTKVHLVVVGDLILDSYLECQAVGVANEAPVPFLQISGQSHALGGAANVAHNLARLGVRVTLIGLIGDDQEGSILTKLAREASIDFRPLKTERPTTRKTRVQASGHYYLRLDEEEAAPLNEAQGQGLLRLITESMESAQMLLASDYDKGTFKGPVVDKLQKLSAAKGFKIVGDIKPQNIQQWQKLSCITPNLPEARDLYSRLIPGSACPDDHLELGRVLARTLSCHVVLTLAEKGIVASTPRGEAHHFPAIGVRAENVSGAGDTVAAVVATSLCSYAELEDAAQLANLAAGIAISHPGTYAVTHEELTRILQDLANANPGS
ncbi:MAG: PfkB family carbohydrate kinase [Terriglobia bacterium]